MTARHLLIILKAFSAFVDICLALFPITIFWDLKMKISRKISISVLMSLGILWVHTSLVQLFGTD